MFRIQQQRDEEAEKRKREQEEMKRKLLEELEALRNLRKNTKFELKVEQNIDEDLQKLLDQRSSENITEVFNEYLQSFKDLETIKGKKRGSSKELDIGNPNYLRWTTNFERKSSLWNEKKNQLEDAPQYLKQPTYSGKSLTRSNSQAQFKSSPTRRDS